MPTPEDQAREHIDQALEQAGWRVQDYKSANLQAGRGVVIRNFPLVSGHGFADYLLYVDGKAAGIIEAKKEGVTLIGVEVQAEKYSKGLPTDLPAHIRPLPFLYQSTGVETRFTNGLDPQPRSRPVFSFHRPETLATLIPERSGAPSDLQGASLAAETSTTFRGRLRTLPPLSTTGLWPTQITAINNLEKSLAQDRPRALIQMATGSGKTFTAINFIYRLIKFGGARRVLFLVDRGNLGDQTLKEFQQYVSPYNNFKFTEEFIVQRLAGNTIDTTARVCISTIQRMYSMLKGRELSDEDEEASVSGLERLFKQPEPIDYNPAIPIETFDIIVTDECHRSIYNLWAQVLEYFDAHLIGLTATPNKQTFGFFNQNLVMEYSHEQAVADGVNVNYDVYRIRTAITQAGSTVDAGYSVQVMNRETRAKRWERLDDDFAYNPDQLDRDVVAPDQIRTIVKAFKDKLFTDIFPGRTEVPKTLIFAKDDAHAENIVEILREEFGKGNEFAQKITYRTTGVNPKDLIKTFRNSYHPRIAVTVDMIATGTDIKPVEIVVFMRAVKSRTFFEQMKGRGVRIIKPDDLKAVTPDATSKDHFVIVDTVGVCDQDKTDSRPMEKKPSVAFDKLLQAVALGNTEEDVLTSIAGRLARMEHRITKEDEQAISKASGGLTLKDLSRRLVEAVNPDRYTEQANLNAGLPADSTKPVSQQAIQAAATKLIKDAVTPLHDPKLRELLIEIKKKNELTIDHVSQDQVIEAGFSADALARARTIVQSFEQFITQHKDEITALQILYSKPYKQRLKFEDIKDLANAIEKPPYLWNESQLWQAYAALEKSKVKGASSKRILTDLVSLVRFATHQDNELVPFPEKVNANFRAWIGEQENRGKKFTDEQCHWLEMIRDHVAANLAVDQDDFEYAPFAQEGGLGKVRQVFGNELNSLIEELKRIISSMSNMSVSTLLSELPTGWSRQSLGHVLKVRNGFAFKSSDYQESGVLLIRQSNLGGNRVSLDKAEYLPEQFLKDHKDFQVRKGDVLIGMSGSIGKLCVYDLDEPALQNQRTGLLQFKDDSLKRWIWYYLPLIENKLHEGGKGIGVQNISASQIEALPIPIAPKEHRVHIVAEIEKQFSRLEEAVANLKRVKANLKRYKASVLKAAVEGKLTEDWRKQHPDVEPASKLLERILAERRAKWTGKGKYKEPVEPNTNNLGSIPNGWIWAALEQLCPRFVDSAHRTPRYGQTGVPALGPRDVVGGRLNVTDARLVDEAEYATQTERYMPEAGDIVYSRELSLGWGVILPPGVRVCLSQGMCLFRPHKAVDPRYFMIVLNGPHGRHQAELAATGSAHPHVNLGDIKKYSIPLLPSPEQEQIIAEVERRLSVIEKLQAAVEADLTRADRLRQSVLGKAFSGTLGKS